MGLPHSGELADLLLLLKETTTILKASFCNGLRAYYRYKDDLVIAIDDFSDTGNHNVIEMWWNFIHGCKPYSIKHDELNRHGFTMLDVTFFKGERWAGCKYLDYKPYIKPTSLGMVLNVSSAHVPIIHEQWPLAEAKRFQRLSSSRGHYEVSRDLLIQRLVKFDSHPHVITNIKNTFPSDRKQVDRLTSLRRWHNQLLMDESKKGCVWLPFPYHAAWYSSGIAGCIRRYCFSSLAESFLKPLRMKIQCRLAWKLTSRPLSIEIAAAGKYRNVNSENSETYS